MSEAPVRCPFVPGQVIQEVSSLGLGSRATVTAITERGFTYEYLNPVSFGRAAWGQVMTGGECFERGYQYWVAAEF